MGTAWLTRGVAGIGAASFLSDLGHEVPTSLLPSLLVSTLGTPASVLGLVEGVADALAGIARVAGGPLADDPERRRTIAVGGYASTAILSSLLGAVGAVWQVGILRSGAWFSRGFRVPARNALLANVVAPSAYGRAYGFERAMDNLGAIGGPLLALLLVTLVGVRTAILLSVIPGLFAAAAIVYAIRRLPREAARKRAAAPIRSRVRSVLAGRLGQLLTGVGFFEAGHVAATLLILRATEMLTPSLGQVAATQVALGLYTAYNAAATLASFPAGRAGDRRGPSLILAVGVGLFLLSYLGFAVELPNLLLLGVSFVVAGVAIGLVETSQHASVASLAPRELRGSAFGLLAGVQSFGNLVASALAGVLWTAFSPTVAFLYLAGWMLVALAVLLRLTLQQCVAQ